MKRFSLFIILFFAFLLFVPQMVFAVDIGSLISDSTFTNSAGMSREHISRFLSSKSGRLGSYTTIGSGGVSQSAADIIYESALKYSINPKVIITTLQKESSSITKVLSDDSLERYVMGYAVCDSCSTEDPYVQQYRGFYNQVDSATYQFRRYMDYPQNYRHQVGSTYNVDGQEVLVKNQASASLLNYTPHIHGNELFYSIWQSWFLRHYGNGSLLRAEGELGVYLVQDGVIRPFKSKSAFLAHYSFDDVIVVSRSDLDAYEQGAPIQFAETALLQDSSTGGVYLHINNTKRPIVSREVFRQLGFNPEEIASVDPSELVDIPTGEKIDSTDQYPLGALLQSKQNGGVVYVEDGVAHAIYDKSILLNRFKNRTLMPVDHSELLGYSYGDPLKFRDGTLVTSPSHQAVYVIEDGLRRPFPSREIFESLGYSFGNVIRTSDRAMELHPLGENITTE